MWGTGTRRFFQWGWRWSMDLRVRITPFRLWFFQHCCLKTVKYVFQIFIQINPFSFTFKADLSIVIVPGGCVWGSPSICTGRSLFVTIFIFKRQKFGYSLTDFVSYLSCHETLSIVWNMHSWFTYMSALSQPYTGTNPGCYLSQMDHPTDTDNLQQSVVLSWFIERWFFFIRTPRICPGSPTKTVSELVSVLYGMKPKI